MRDDFAVLILTNGRPDNVLTWDTLAKSGYTGRAYLVVDDEDPTADDYRARYGADRVVVFSKSEVAAAFDQADNFADRRAVFYARNACWAIAEDLGLRYFIQLDDDYNSLLYRLEGRQGGEAEAGYHGWTIRSLDKVLGTMVDFVEATGAASLAMSQGGDHLGGDQRKGGKDVRLARKAMNSFVCDVRRPFEFRGRVNEDVSTYVSLGNVGLLFFTYWALQLNQTVTQKATGGMSGLYLDGGTYIKSFYSVMMAPSCVKIRWIPGVRRLHHRINWDAAVPKIVPEKYRKDRGTWTDPETRIVALGGSLANVRHVDPDLLQNRRGGRGRGVAVPGGRPRGWRAPSLPREVTTPIAAPTLSRFQPAAVAHTRTVWREWWKSSASLAVDLESDLEAISWWAINVFRRALYFQVVRESPLTTGSQGQPVRNPLTFEIRALTADINRAADRFGMDVLGRFRLHFEALGERGDEDDEDVVEGVLGEYRQLLAEGAEDDDVA